MTTDARPVSKPCRACPWRADNHGKPHPDGWYTKTNLRRLWTGMKAGEQMSCHPTDSKNPVSDQAKAQGYREAPAHAEVAECAGVTILKQREYIRFQDDHAGDFKAYRASGGPRMTPAGLLSTALRATTASNPITGVQAPRVDLDDLAVQYPPLGEWTPR